MITWVRRFFFFFFQCQLSHFVSHFIHRPSCEVWGEQPLGRFHTEHTVYCAALIHMLNNQRRTEDIPCARCTVSRTGTDGVGDHLPDFSPIQVQRFARSQIKWFFGKWICKRAAFIFHSLFVVLLIYSVSDLWCPKKEKKKKKKKTFTIIPKVITVQAGACGGIRQNSKSALWGRTNHVSLLLPKKQWCNIS